MPQETRNKLDRATPHYVYRLESTGTSNRGNQPAYDSVPDKCARKSPIGSYVTRLVKRPKTYKQEYKAVKGHALIKKKKKKYKKKKKINKNKTTGILTTATGYEGQAPQHKPGAEARPRRQQEQGRYNPPPHPPAQSWKR